MQDLLIFPYNGNGLEALDCLGEEYNFIGFVDDTQEKQGITPFGHNVFDRTAFEKFPKAKVLAVPGSPASFKNRKNIIADLHIPDSRLTSVIHPDAFVSERAELGMNCLIYAGVIITSNAKIGNHVCILPNSVLHHDTVIGDYTLIGSNICIAGHTEIGENCYIGSGSNIINNIKIGNAVMVGMGSNVIRDISENLRIAGNPAKAL